MTVITNTPKATHHAHLTYCNDHRYTRTHHLMMCVSRGGAGKMGVVVVWVVEVVVVVLVKADTPHAPHQDIDNGVLSRYPGQDDYISELIAYLLRVLSFCHFLYT